MTPPEEVGYAHSMTAPGYRTAIVTGASRGIGAATVRRLRRDGLAVYAVARSAEPLEALAKETGCTPHVLDIARPRRGAEDARPPRSGRAGQQRLAADPFGAGVGSSPPRTSTRWSTSTSAACSTPWRQRCPA
jgi:NAD(P)-dependent dehydrogenase (short-subunit alcohol dehydrogenase family)